MADLSLLTPGLTLAGLLLLSAFFSASETALFSLPFARTRAYGDSPSRRERLIARLMRRPQDALVTILAGNMLVNVAAAVLVTLTVRRLMSDLFPDIPAGYSIPVAIGIMTLLLLFFGEVTPKTYAVNNAAFFAKIAVYPLALFSWIILPLRILFRVVTWITTRLAGGKEERQQALTREELVTALRHLSRAGTVRNGKGKLIENVLRFGDRTVRDVMVSRRRIHSLASDDDFRTIMNRVRGLRHKTVPVYLGSLDHFIGLLHVKDLLPYVHNGKRFPGLLSLLRPIHCVRGHRTLPDIITEFQARRADVAIVQDRRGRTIGLVTMDDILEEVVGRLYA